MGQGSWAAQRSTQHITQHSTANRSAAQLPAMLEPVLHAAPPAHCVAGRRPVKLPLSGSATVDVTLGAPLGETAVNTYCGKEAS